MIPAMVPPEVQPQSVLSRGCRRGEEEDDDEDEEEEPSLVVNDRGSF